MSRERNDRDSGRGGRDDDRGSSRGERGGREETPRRGREEERGGRDRGDDRGGHGRDEGRSSGRGASYEYKARDDGDSKKRAASGGGDFDKMLVDSVKVWKPNDGDNRIRIVPPTWKDAKHYGLDVYVHYGIGPDRQSYLDLFKMKGEPDPITEEYTILKRDADGKNDEDDAKELSAKRRVLIYLIDRDHEKEGVQAWFMPAGLDQDIVKVSIDKSSGEVLPLDHPEDGYDVSFEKNGTGIKTKYEGVSIARRSSPLGKSEWLDYAVENTLPDQLNYFDYDYIAKIFNGGGSHKGGERSTGSREERSGSGNDRDRDGRDHQDSDRGGRERVSTGDNDRSSSRIRDEAPSRGRSRASEEPTWDSIHSMTGSELDAMVEQEKLDIDPGKAKDDEDLADWICEEMKIKKVEASSRRSAAKPDEGLEDRLSRMRSNRD